MFVACGLWHGATWAWLAYGLYNGVLMSLHRVWDRTLTGVPWADALRATVVWKLLLWAGTFLMVAAGLILIRMPSWEAGAIVARSLLGLDVLSGWSAAVPVWVPVLLVLVIIGHLFSGLRNKLCGLLELPSPVRATVYVGAVVLLVTLSPGVGKTFIYLAF